MAKITDLSAFADSTQNFGQIYKKRQGNRFGSFEKQLIALIILLGSLFIVFFVLFLLTQHWYNELLKGENVCRSKECIESAMTLFQTIDFRQDPCEDFYQFACGKFPEEHPVNENGLHNSWFAEDANQLNRMILNILKNPENHSDSKSLRQTKIFYRSCTNESELNAMGLKPLYDILEMLELPKFLPTNDTVGNFNLARTLALAQRYLSQDILVAVSIAKESANVSSRPGETFNIFKLSPASAGSSAFNVFKKTDRDEFGRNLFSKRPEKMKREMRFSGDSKFSSKQTKNATIRFVTEILEKINGNDSKGDSGGFNGSHYSMAAREIINFTSILLKDVIDEGENKNKKKAVRTTFSDFENQLYGNGSNGSISNRIDWREYISVLLENSNKTYDANEEIVLVENEKYFRTLSKTLEETLPEEIQRHIWWKIVEGYARYTTSDVRMVYVRYYQALYGESSMLPRSQFCSNLMKRTMGVALSHEMAIVRNFTRASKKILEMLKDIEMAFEDIVNSTTWMDSKTKSVTLGKAKGLRNEIGYAKWMTDPEKIAKFYENLELKESEFLMNIVRVSQWEVQQVLKSLGKVNKNSTEEIDWFINPLQVNAYYSHTENAIIIPAGILRTPFYFRGLESLNYGAIGTILGHELTHGFDVEGKNYNKLGELQENLWPSKIVREYEERAKCFVKQYESYMMYNNSRVNGSFTLAENIADNGGIRESFKAYQLYIARHGPEPKLPGFENFTSEQLLFLSYANIWCETATPMYYMFSQDTHSPQRVRVLVTLQNMKEFSEVYKCSKDSFMNPQTKCKIW